MHQVHYGLTNNIFFTIELNILIMNHACLRKLDKNVQQKIIHNFIWVQTFKIVGTIQPPLLSFPLPSIGIRVLISWLSCINIGANHHGRNLKDKGFKCFEFRFNSILFLFQQDFVYFSLKTWIDLIKTIFGSNKLLLFFWKTFLLLK